MLAQAIAAANDLTVAINLDPQSFSAVTSERGLFEQRLSTGVRNVVFGHDASP